MPAKKKISRQRVWQLKRIAEGRCQICGSERMAHAVLCDVCNELKNSKRRKGIDKAGAK